VDTLLIRDGCKDIVWVFYALATDGSPVIPLNASSSANVDGKGFASDAFGKLPSSTKYVGA